MATVSGGARERPRTARRQPSPLVKQSQTALLQEAREYLEGLELEFAAACKSYDRKGQGSISYLNVRRALAQIGVELRDEVMVALFSAFDVGRSGNIDAVQLAAYLDSNRLRGGTASSALANAYANLEIKEEVEESVCESVTGIPELAEDTLDVAEFINSYRESVGLPRIPISYKLTALAELHCWDLEANEPDKAENASVHSWSSNVLPGYTWKAVNYLPDHQTSKEMLNKGREAVSYQGDVYEVAASMYMTDTAYHALQMWQSEWQDHQLILGEGIWSDMPFLALGAARGRRGAASAFFGVIEDSGEDWTPPPAEMLPRPSSKLSSAYPPEVNKPTTSLEMIRRAARKVPRRPRHSGVRKVSFAGARLSSHRLHVLMPNSVRSSPGVPSLQRAVPGKKKTSGKVSQGTASFLPDLFDKVKQAHSPDEAIKGLRNLLQPLADAVERHVPISADLGDAVAAQLARHPTHDGLHSAAMPVLAFSERDKDVDLILATLKKFMAKPSVVSAAAQALFDAPLTYDGKLRAWKECDSVTTLVKALEEHKQATVQTSICRGLHAMCFADETAADANGLGAPFLLMEVLQHAVVLAVKMNDDLAALAVAALDAMRTLAWEEGCKESFSKGGVFDVAMKTLRSGGRQDLQAAALGFIDVVCDSSADNCKWFVEHGLMDLLFEKLQTEQDVDLHCALLSVMEVFIAADGIDESMQKKAVDLCIEAVRKYPNHFDMVSASLTMLQHLASIANVKKHILKVGVVATIQKCVDRMEKDGVVAKKDIDQPAAGLATALMYLSHFKELSGDKAAAAAAAAKAAEHFEKAGVLIARDAPGFHAYNAACCHALAGNLEAAAKCLREGEEHGELCDWETMAADATLAACHGEPWWEELLTRVQDPDKG